MKHTLSYQEILPWFVLFYFINWNGLPEGLLYTTLLTPVWIYLLHKWDKKKWLWWLPITLVLPLIFQINVVVGIMDYLKSTFLLITALLFFLSMKLVIDHATTNHLRRLFNSVRKINMWLVLLAVLLLPFQFGRDLLWYEIPISPGIPAFPRLKLFSYESSYYALLLFPVFLLFALRSFLPETKNRLLILSSVIVPLILSLSFGVLGAGLLGVILALTIHLTHVPGQLKKGLTYSGLTGLSILLVLFVLWPDNPAITRISNIIEGSDTSARGRLFESFMFAFDIARFTDPIWGCGPGQIKLLAHDLIIDYYQYEGEFAEIVRIPNGMAELLATYGWYGVFVKVGLEVYAFFRYKLWQNLFNLSLFLFIFIYQFTGSYLMNVAEFSVWAIAIWSRFDEFEYRKPQVS